MVGRLLIVEDQQGSLVPQVGRAIGTVGHMERHSDGEGLLSCSWCIYCCKVSGGLMGCYHASIGFLRSLDEAVMMFACGRRSVMIEVGCE